MTSRSTPAWSDEPATPLSADAATRIAWRIWFVLLTAPFIVFLGVVWRLMDNDTAPADPRSAQRWLIAVVIYMALGVPGALFWRHHIFRGYLSGRVVSPRRYLLGMIVVWGSLEIGGLLALLGCLVTNSLLPNLLPALLAFVLFTPLWPNGHAMIRPLTNEQDPADYEEPR